MNNLACLYRDGEGLARNESKAVQLFRIAAEKGEIAAANNLAVLYRHGQGSALNLVDAKKWFRHAAQSGYAMSMHHLAYMLQHGLGGPPSPQEAEKWLQRFEKACTAHESYVWACRWLSFCVHLPNRFPPPLIISSSFSSSSSSSSSSLSLLHILILIQVPGRPGGLCSRPCQRHPMVLAGSIRGPRTCGSEAQGAGLLTALEIARANCLQEESKPEQQGSVFSSGQPTRSTGFSPVSSFSFLP
jgi:hypothetical protein